MKGSDLESGDIVAAYFTAPYRHSLIEAGREWRKVSREQPAGMQSASRRHLCDLTQVLARMPALAHSRGLLCCIRGPVQALARAA